jgi:hypothetical protein
VGGVDLNGWRCICGRGCGEVFVVDGETRCPVCDGESLQRKNRVILAPAFAEKGFARLASRKESALASKGIAAVVVGGDAAEEPKMVITAESADAQDGEVIVDESDVEPDDDGDGFVDVVDEEPDEDAESGHHGY